MRALRSPLWIALLLAFGLRLLYGFLLIFLAFAIRSGEIGGGMLGVVAGPFVQLVLVGSSFGMGTLIATVIGTGRRVHHPVALQTTGIVLVWSFLAHRIWTFGSR